ncbi:helix-turn-helix transcriptional regulator [Novosphingobium terrae]|uniref:helix-turn-helix transcriptional regulator n=1 Tax=Novosphingobium terrae TaxID=2726189 RepID=UPI00197D467A|nr:LuxR C-terminal-related transcriptional regulator [Novosphingobium terrae]
MSRPDLTRLIQGAYEAALQDHLWEPWSLDLMKALGGSGGVFWLVNNEEHRVERAISGWGPARGFEDYMEEQYRHDPQLRLAASLPGTQVFVGLPGVDVEPKPVRDYLQWQRTVVRNVHHQTAVTKLDNGCLQAGISIHRHGGLGPVEQADHQAMQTIWPELKRAMSLGFTQGDLLQAAFWDGLITGREGQIAFLIDDRARVIRLTHEAEGMIDGLSIRRHRLHAAHHGEQAELDRIIATAVTREAPQSGAMRLTRPSGRRPLVLIAYPLPRSSRMLAPAEAAGLITVIDPGAARSPHSALLRQAFALTEREAELATLLLKGHSVESAASTLAIAMPTARTHMRRLYEKTGTTGQVAMIELLLRIAL